MCLLSMSTKMQLLISFDQMCCQFKHEQKDFYILAPKDAQFYKAGLIHSKTILLFLFR